mgnify:CR=1 FL=1
MLLRRLVVNYAVVHILKCRAWLLDQLVGEAHACGWDVAITVDDAWVRVKEVWVVVWYGYRTIVSH